jgi:hypothetical protein
MLEGPYDGVVTAYRRDVAEAFRGLGGDFAVPVLEARETRQAFGTISVNLGLLVRDGATSEPSENRMARFASVRFGSLRVP